MRRPNLSGEDVGPLDRSTGADSCRWLPISNDHASFYAHNYVACEVPTTLGVGAIAEVAALVGDPSRTNMLMALLDGFALTAKELAEHAGVTPQTASGHISKLHAAGLIEIERHGRTHLHRLRGGLVRRMLDILARVAVAAATDRRAPRQPCADAGIGIARICSGHLAGGLAVMLAQRLLDESRTGLSLEGRSLLESWGLTRTDLEHEHQDAAICLDWSEESPHLAGRVGSAILERCLALKWVTRVPRSRGLIVTGIGLRGFQAEFGLNVPKVSRF